MKTDEIYVDSNDFAAPGSARDFLRLAGDFGWNNINYCSYYNFVYYFRKIPEGGKLCRSSKRLSVKRGNEMEKINRIAVLQKQMKEKRSGSGSIEDRRNREYLVYSDI